jgi:peptidoglycan/LPS O-acetylase OafA/YrhL
MAEDPTRSTEHAPPSAAHVPELDGIRGLAVLAVMLFHQTVIVPTTAFEREWTYLCGYGASGVDLFFVLSGFLITGILVDTRANPRYYRNFYARRFLRIVPLYYALLFVALVVLPWFPHPKLAKWGHTSGWGQVPYWLFLSNWSIALSGHGPRHGMIDLSWTLSIEEQFYLTWPLVVRWLSRERLMQVCLGLMAASLLVRWGIWYAGGSPILVAFLTPSRMDGLATGAWIALAVRAPGGLKKLVPLARGVAIVAGAAALAMVVFPGLHGHDGRLLQIVFPTLLALTFGGLVASSIGGPRGSWRCRALRGRFLTTFGVFSYALYLLHYPILGVIRDAVYRPERFPTLLGSSMPGQLIFYAVATLAALACAWLSWHLYEKPWLSLKRYFPAVGPTPPL